MRSLAFDTLGTSKKLEAAGMERKQAEAVATAIAEREGNIATKYDINLLKDDIKSVKDDIKSVKDDIKSVKDDIKSVRFEFDTKIDSLRAEVASLRTELDTKIDSKFRWLMGMQMVTVFAVVGLIVSL